jgi:hypothetical protein
VSAHSARRFAPLALILVPLVLLLAASRLEAHFGLIGQYYSNADWQGEAVSRIDRQLTTHLLTPPPGLRRNAAFSAEWDGFLYVPRTGRYRFQLISDDGSWLELDGRLVIDNGGNHAPVLREQLVDLAAGPRAVRVRFFQGTGEWRLNLLWAEEGAQPEPIAGASLLHVPMGSWAHAAARTLHAIAPYLPVFWLVAAALLAAELFSPYVARWRVTEQLDDPWLWSVVLGSFLLNVVGIWWGLSGGRWAADEILPFQVLDALDRKFSGGWFGPYPPVQYYLLGLLYLPFVAAEWVMNLQINPLLHFLNRIASLAMAAGIVVLVYICAKTLTSRIGGRAAAALTALLLPFVYYAKIGNLDVPYLFWFCAAILFYIRIVVHDDTASYVGFAIAAALAIATKDQAYGYFVAPAVHVAILRYVRLEAASKSHSEVIKDLAVPGAAFAGLTTLAVAYNLPFNWSGFTRHVALITSNAGDRYRMFDENMEGQLELLSHSIELIRFSFGWPAFILIAAGLIATTLGSERRTRLWLLLPIVSYYCSFLAMVSIVFDRFVLGICILLAIIAGCAVADWISSGVPMKRTIAVVSVVAVCLYSLVRAVSLNAMMMADSRYYVENWIATQVPPEAAIDSAGPEAYLPRVFWSDRINADDETAASDADYVVINAGHAQRYGPSSTESNFYERLKDERDYSLVLRYRTPLHWSPLARDPVFADSAEHQFTNLDKINPVIEVYRRK